MPGAFCRRYSVCRKRSRETESIFWSHQGFCRCCGNQSSPRLSGAACSLLRVVPSSPSMHCPCEPHYSTPDSLPNNNASVDRNNASFITSHLHSVGYVDCTRPFQGRNTGSIPVSATKF